MNNQIIQKILKTKINFSVFNIIDMSEDQMEVVFHNLKSKITKQNPIFERMLEKQKESEDGFYNKKTVQIIIQYLLSENQYTTDDIKQIINRTINIFEMMEENNVEEQKFDNMNELIELIELGEIEDFTKYINKLNDKQYEMMKKVIEEEEIEDFFDEIMNPYIQYHFNKSERFVSVDLIYDFLVRLNKDKSVQNKSFFFNKIINYILTEDKVLSLALKKEDTSVIYNYLNVLKVENEKLSIFKKSVKVMNNTRIKKNQPKDYSSFSEHREHLDISGLNKKLDIKIIEILYVMEELAMKQFLNELKYDENKVKKIITNLKKVNIKTYYKLENLVLKNQFVQKMRKDNQKILPGKIVKMIIYKILDKHNKLELLKEQKIDISTDLDILNFQFEKMTHEVKKTTFKDMKNQRINLNNLIILLKENGEDYKKQEKELKKLDNEIKTQYLKMETEDLLQTNIDDITDMINVLDLEEHEKRKMGDMINNYNKILNDQRDIYGENFNKENDKIFINRNIDKNLTNLVEKYNKEYEKEEKKDKKERYIQLQNDLVNEYLKVILKDIDMNYHVNNMKLYELISDFIKHQMNIKIIPRIYKLFDLGNKYQRTESVFQILKLVIHMFMIVLNFTNKQIDYSKVYDSLDKIIRVNKKIRKVLIKVNGKEAELIKERKNDVVIEYLGEEITMKKSEIRFIEDLIGKDIRVTRGVYKGNMGRIYLQKADYVLATKDTYGKNPNNSELPRVVPIKLKYGDFKINEDEETRKFFVDNKELYDYYNKKDKKLYSMTKFEMNKYYTIEDMVNYEQMYKLIIELLNDYKMNEYNSYQKIVELKREYVQLKKQIEDNKGNKRKYITLSKKLKKLHKEIRNMEKNSKLIKQTLINKSENLNDNYTYVKVDGLFLLKEHTIVRNKTENGKKMTSEEKKEQKKLKNKQDKIKREQIMNNMVEVLHSMMEDLIN